MGQHVTTVHDVHVLRMASHKISRRWVSVRFEAEFKGNLVATVHSDLLKLADVSAEQVDPMRREFYQCGSRLLDRGFVQLVCTMKS